MNATRLSAAVQRRRRSRSDLAIAARPMAATTVASTVRKMLVRSSKYG